MFRQNKEASPIVNGTTVGIFRSSLLNSEGAKVGLRTKYIVTKKQGVPAPNLLPFSDGEVTQLSQLVTAYATLCRDGHAQIDLADTAYNRARGAREAVEPIVLSDGQQAFITDARLGQVYARESEKEYEFVVDLASSPDTFRTDPEFYSETISKVPEQFLFASPTVRDPNHYVLRNVSPFMLTFPDGETVQVIMLSRFVADREKKLSDNMQIFVRLLAKEGFFPIDLEGKPLIQLSDIHE